MNFPADNSHYKKLNQFMPIITLSKSVQLMWLLGAVHALTLLVVWLLPFSLLWRATLSILIVASLCFYLHRDAFKLAHQSIVSIKCLPDCKLELQRQTGEWITASLQPGSFVAPYLTTLAYRPQEKYFTRHVIILPDMLDENTFRELRVQLRWQSP
jgi:toxin CptA